MPLLSAVACEELRDVFDDGSDVDLRAVRVKATGFHLGEVEYVVDDFEQCFGRTAAVCAYSRCVSSSFVPMSRVVHSDHAIHRCADLWLMLARNSDLCRDGITGFVARNRERRLDPPLPTLESHGTRSDASRPLPRETAIKSTVLRIRVAPA